MYDGESNRYFRGGTKMIYNNHRGELISIPIRTVDKRKVAFARYITHHTPLPRVIWKFNFLRKCNGRADAILIARIRKYFLG